MNAPEGPSREECPGSAEYFTRTEDGVDSLYGEISREMVRLYKKEFGRGPIKARTQFAGPNCIVCTLEKVLTPAEHRQVELGEERRLRDTRMFSQYAAEGRFQEIIERLSHRRVRAFVSGVDIKRDVAAEVYLLALPGSP
jgi:uncharacterized protein YbcI